MLIYLNNWNDASVTAEIILYFQLTRSNIKIDSSGNGYEDFDIEWQIEDYGGNTTNYTQTIIIFDNSYPSVIDPVPAAGINISPIEEFAANNNNTSITLPRLVARDNIAIKFLQYKTDISGNYQNWPNWDDASGNQGDDDITLYYSLTGSDLTIPTSGSGYEEFFIYWKIEDYANNITEHIQTIIITDNIGPEISDITTDVSGANQNEKSVEMRVDVPKVTDNVSLNSDINLQYQVFDQSGNTIVDWTDTSGTSITISVEYPDSGHAYGGVIDYTGNGEQRIKREYYLC